MGWFPHLETDGVTYEDGDPKRRRLRYWINETTSHSVAENTAGVNLPLTFGPLVLKSYEVKRVGWDLFSVVASYVDPDDPRNEEKPDLGEIVWSFDTGGGMTHLTAAEKGNTTPYVAAGDTAFDSKGAINFNGSSVEGVDIVIPRLTLTANARLAGGTISNAWVRSVARLTGKVNEDPWQGYEAGELLLMGVSGSQRAGGGDPTLSFSFEASENVQNLVFEGINGDITVSTKAGHQYLWVRFATAADGAAGGIVQQPQTVYVETVYKDGDFSILGLGS